MKYLFVGGPLDGQRTEVKNPVENLLVPKTEGWQEFSPVQYCRMNIAGRFVYRHHEVVEETAVDMILEKYRSSI